MRKGYTWYYSSPFSGFSRPQTKLQRWSMRDLQWRHFSPRNIVREQTIKQFLAYNHWLLRRLFQSFSSRISDKDIIRYGLNDVRCSSFHEPLTTLHSNIVLRVGDSSFQLLCPIVGRTFADCLSFRLLYYSCLLTYLPIKKTSTQAICCCKPSLETRQNRSFFWLDYWCRCILMDCSCYMLSSQSWHFFQCHCSCNDDNIIIEQAFFIKKQRLTADLVSVAISGWSLKVQQT